MESLGYLGDDVSEPTTRTSDTKALMKAPNLSGETARRAKTQGWSYRFPVGLV